MCSTGKTRNPSSENWWGLTGLLRFMQFHKRKDVSVRFTAEVSRELGVPIRTIWFAVSTRKVAAVRWGRECMLPNESIEALRAICTQ